MIALRSRGIREDIPVILCSGSEEALQELQEERKDIQIFLPKPFSRSELAEAIQDVLACDHFFIKILQ